METRVKFEKVGDIANRYAFLEVFINEDPVSIMNIIVTDDQELCVKIWSNPNDIVITISQLETIIKEAKVFISEVINDEISFDKFMDSQDQLE